MTSEDDRRAVLALTTAIKLGKFDEWLPTIKNEIQARQNRLALDLGGATINKVPVSKQTMLADVPVGSRIRFNREVRPQYLKGETGVVLNHNRSRGGKYDIEVRIDRQVRKYTPTNPIRVMLEVIEPA